MNAARSHQSGKWPAIDFQNPSFYKPAHARAFVRRNFVAPRPARQSSCCSSDRIKKGRTPRYQTNEAYLSTVETRPQAPARLPCPHGHQGWPRRRRRPPQPRPQAALRLSEGEGNCRTPASPCRPHPSGFASGRSSWPSGVVKSAAGGCSSWRCWTAATATPRVSASRSPKKVGNAVIRNRIRRRLKEAVRVHAAGDMQPGNDYVIVGREEVLTAPFAAIKPNCLAGFAERVRTKGFDGKQPQFLHHHRAVGADPDALAGVLHEPAHRGRARGRQDPAGRVEEEKKAAAPADPGVTGGDVPALPQGAVPGGAGGVPGAETRDAAIAATPARQDRHTEPLGLDQPHRRAHRRRSAEALPRDGRQGFAHHRTAQPVDLAQRPIRRDRLRRQRRDRRRSRPPIRSGQSKATRR